MPASARSRLLLLLLAVLLPGIAAAAWALFHTYQAEQQAVERRLSHATQALSRDIDGVALRRTAPAGQTAAGVREELQITLDRQALPSGWVAAVVDPAGAVLARHPRSASEPGAAAQAELEQQRALKPAGRFESHGFAGGPAMAYFMTSASGWTSVTGMPRSQFITTVASAVARVAVGALVLLGLALAGVWWVAVRRPAGATDSGVDERSSDRWEPPIAADSGRVEALGRLTGGVVHDFNNLLGVISNSAHLIQRQAPGPELQAPVAATLRAVEAGSRLTQQLMRFGGRQPAPPHAVDLASTLTEADEFLKAIAGKRIEVSVAVAPATRQVVVDAGALELALTTLTLNARDAMPAGGRLRLQAGNAVAADTNGLPAGDYVLITVGDDGNADAQGAAPASGLEQVHSFCVRSGGTSRLASTPGLGTTVSMLLPAC